MNENLNLVEILKDCPKGTKLYSHIVGEVELKCINNDFSYSIVTYCKHANTALSFTKEGLYYLDAVDGECMLFPSKDQRDWSKFKVKKPKFDPKTLQPFDKVLGRNNKSQKWKCQLFSNIRKIPKTYPYVCLGYYFKYCIPYNDDTKHLLGTTEEAPEFYRYWED